MSEEVEQISIPNVPIKLKQILEGEAIRQRRSLANLCRIYLIEHAEQIAAGLALAESEPQPAADPKQNGKTSKS